MARSAHEQDEWSDDEPPLLEEDAKEETVNNQRGGNEASIMDEMVAIATEAKAAKRRQQDKERYTMSFGAGLKKGFFNQSKPTKSKKSGPEKLDFSETAVAKKKEDAFRLVKPPTETNQTSEENGSAFVFPEVQDALKSMNQLNPKEWMNEQFFAKMAKNPKLLQALQNPRFTQAMSELQQNPQAAVLKYQRDLDVSLMLRDFMEFMGSHFEELGKAEEKREKQTPPAPLAPPAIVDLDETRRQAIANMKRSPDEEAQVQKILQNPELLAALSDAKLMDQLHACQQDPRALQRLARDPVLGPKLRLLVDAKMVAFA